MVKKPLQVSSTAVQLQNENALVMLSAEEKVARDLKILAERQIKMGDIDGANAMLNASNNLTLSPLAKRHTLIRE